MAGGFGGLEFKNSTTVSTIIPDVPQYTPIDHSENGGDLAFNTTAVAGYAWDFSNQYHLALEAFTDSNNAQLTFEKSVALIFNENSTFNLRSVYGLRVLPGYAVTEQTNVYAILGVARAHTTLTDNLNSEGTTMTQKTNYDFTGYQVGLGEQTQLTPHVLLRGDLIYTDYPTKTVDESYGNNSATAVIQLKPSTIEANLLLGYQFG